MRVPGPSAARLVCSQAMRAHRGLAACVLLVSAVTSAQMKTAKPPLHGSHWMAVTGKPLAATAGAKIFERGGNAVDAAAAMIAATCTMWDTLSWGGETQALIYDPHQKKVIGIDALGVAPTGATPDFFKGKGMKYPPEFGPLAAVTPGTPGGIMTMEAEYGKLSLAEILAPAIEMAEGYAIEEQSARTIARNQKRLAEWPYSKALFAKPPQAGEIFRQPELAATLRSLVDAEREARARGLDRKAAIYAAYDRFYKGPIAEEIARSVQEQGGLITAADLAGWKVKIEEPVKTSYKGIDVYKLTVWTQGPALLQTLNILEHIDLRAMGFNSARYIHTLYQAISLAFADRDFYYGDPYVGPVEPVAGLLSKEYAKARARLIKPDQNDPAIGPGDPYPFQNGKNPYLDVLKKRTAPPAKQTLADYERTFYAGTTSVVAADAEGWVVSVTPSGGWMPAVIAGHTGLGLSQRMQSFVTDPDEDPFNVVQPGQRPRCTLTPTIALKDGAPYLAFAVQGGDSQDQNLLQFFLDVVEFGMSVQQATEAPNFNSFQMRESFGAHEIKAGRILVASSTPPWVRADLEKMGYSLTFEERTSGPINAILIDRAHGTLWGGSSNHGEDYGIGW